MVTLPDGTRRNRHHGRFGWATRELGAKATSGTVEVRWPPGLAEKTPVICSLQCTG